jgi:hypothetical protein
MVTSQDVYAVVLALNPLVYAAVPEWRGTLTADAAVRRRSTGPPLELEA